MLAKLAETNTSSMKSMANMFGGKQPELRKNTFEEDQRDLDILMTQLPDGERIYMSSLAKNLPLILENLTLSVGEEEAARFLYNAFGLPDPEILELATPVHLDLLNKLNEANQDVEQRVSLAKISLIKLVKEIEKIVITSSIIKLKELEDDKKQCEVSLQEVESSETKGATAMEDRLEWMVAHQEKLAVIDKEIQQTESSMGFWFELVSNLESRETLIDTIKTPDIAAPNPELVYSSGGVI